MPKRRDPQSGVADEGQRFPWLGLSAARRVGGRCTQQGLPRRITSTTVELCQTTLMVPLRPPAENRSKTIKV